MISMGIRIAAAACVALLFALAATAQEQALMRASAQMDHSQMDHSQMDNSKMERPSKDRSSMESEAPAPGDGDEMPAHGDPTHGDHNPAFGGLVLMYGLQHFEIVARAEGAVELYLSDAMRTPMPAVTVSDVTVEIERPGGAYESVAMQISDAGDFWRGAGAPLDDPENTTLHLAFVAYGAPYVYALPLAVLRRQAPAGDDAAPMVMDSADAG